MSVLAVVAACFLVSGSTAASPATGVGTFRESTYALWEIHGLGLGEEAVSPLREMLIGEMRRVLGNRLVDARPWIDSQTRQRIDACGGTTECLADVGGALGVDRMIVGGVATLGQHYSLNLKLVDTRQRQDLGKVQASLGGEKALILKGMHELILQLVAPNRLTGALAIQIDVQGADVFIDGKHAGTTPLAGPIENLPPGEHALRLTSPFMRDYFAYVTIHQSKTSQLVVDTEEIRALQATLSAVDSPFYRRWWFWPIVGGVAVAAVGGTLFALSAGDGRSKVVPPAGSLGTVDTREP
jgi:hypothetical protein